MCVRMKFLGIIGAVALSFSTAVASAATLDFTESVFIGTNGNVAGTTYAIMGALKFTVMPRKQKAIFTILKAKYLPYMSFCAAMRKTNTH